MKDQSRWPALQGPHNAQNVAAAVAVGAALGVADEAIAQGARHLSAACRTGWSGSPRRTASCFVNDSKATNPTSTAPALAAYPACPLDPRRAAPRSTISTPARPQLGHVRAAYTIGEAGPMFAQLLEGKVPVERVRDAGRRRSSDAADAARPGEVVLLSPACASFDQFRDYEARGDAFRAAVEALA